MLAAVISGCYRGRRSDYPASVSVSSSHFSLADTRPPLRRGALSRNGPGSRNRPGALSALLQDVSGISTRGVCAGEGCSTKPPWRGAVAMMLATSSIRERQAIATLRLRRGLTPPPRCGALPCASALRCRSTACAGPVRLRCVRSPGCAPRRLAGSSSHGAGAGACAAGSRSQVDDPCSCDVAPCLDLPT